MSWSISVIAPSKAAAKLAVTRQLGCFMLPQEPHAHDFETVLAAAKGAIEACREGTIRITGHGSLSSDTATANGEEQVLGVSMRFDVWSDGPAP
jgi:hypothetical protein